MGTSFQVGEVNGGNTFTVDSIENIDASAGDVVDTAAAELIVHYQIRVGDQQFIGQRLHHFTTQRDADNAITGIELFSRGSGLEFDSSRVVQNLTFDPPGRFVSTVADVNRRGPAEVVLARADNDRLVVEVYRARVELEAAYTWERSGLAVRFVDQSGGDALGHEWDFGDGSGPLFEQNPVKLFAGPGTYQVRLRVQGAASSFSDYTQTITVAASGSGSGGGRASFRYRLIDAPLHEDSYRVDSSSSISFLRLAVGDMNKDGIAEIVTAARNNSGSMLRSVWTLGDPQMPSQFTSRHQSEVLPAAFNTTNAMSLLSVDFDGDSVHATIGNDCRRVLEPQVRQLMWHPPYFTRLQAGAAKLASFGKSTSGGTGLEQRSGSYTTHSVSAHIGASVGSELLGVEASVTATAGYSYQAARGELRGSGNSFQLDQSFSQANGEALLVLEENAFDCYSYQLRRRDFGELDDSAARLCERIDGTHFVSATDARFWDTELAASQIGGPPAQWLPLQREWASLALFRPVSNNASIEAGSSASHATDGLYDSRALIVASATGPSRPYLEVDLQSVQSISNVRIWPAADRPGSLAGARLYVSSTPFTSGDQPPSGAGVSVFSAQPEDGPYGPWSIWTRASTAPHAMLQGRYLRVQHLTGNRLGIAELQAFGDVHAEPPSYPDAVCDPTPRDNRHRARVWDAVSGSDGGFRTIDLRGDILWNGTGAMPGCSNFSGMPQAGIWSNTLIGGSADTSWNLSEQNTNLIGETTSFDSATRVGAEFDIQAGFIATVSGGGGYEYTGGVTEDVQTTSYWGSGLEVGGSVGGFDDQSAVLINACRYNPRPYAYRLLEVSNAGYQHEIYTVDYVVRQGTGLWERGAVPGSCLDLQINPEALIFRSGFEQT
jgi:PKD repeat protein